MQAFRTPENQILIEPVFAQWIQAANGKSLYGFDFLLSSSTSSAASASQRLWLPGWLELLFEQAVLSRKLTENKQEQQGTKL